MMNSYFILNWSCFCLFCRFAPLTVDLSDPCYPAMTSPDSPPLVSPSPCPAPPPSLPSSPTPSSPAPSSSSSLPVPPLLPPTGEVMVLALGRRKQRVLIALSILPNLALAFLLSSDPLLTLSPPHHCRLPGPPPSPEVLNASLPWEKVDRPGASGAPSQCQQYSNSSHEAVVECRDGWDYNVTEGLQNNIVTEVKELLLILLLLLLPIYSPSASPPSLLSSSSASCSSGFQRPHSQAGGFCFQCSFVKVLAFKHIVLIHPDCRCKLWINWLIMCWFCLTLLCVHNSEWHCLWNQTCFLKGVVVIEL